MNKGRVLHVNSKNNMQTTCSAFTPNMIPRFLYLHQPHVNQHLWWSLGLIDRSTGYWFVCVPELRLQSSDARLSLNQLLTQLLHSEVNPA